MKKYTNEFKVGFFVCACLLALFYLVYSTGKLDFKKDGYNIFVTFNEIAGLQTKAPVMLNGLEVGKVDDIRVDYDNDQTRIVLKLWLDSKAKIRDDAVVSIKTLGLMGEKYIQIASRQGKDFITSGAMLTGKPYVDMDAMMDSVNTLVDGNKSGITQIVKNFESTSKNFDDFSADIKAHPWKLLFKTKEKPKPKTQ